MTESDLPAELVYLDLPGLEEVRRQLKSGDQRLALAQRELFVEADRLLGLNPLSVVDKTGSAASGDPHDFHGIGAYSWPNPKTADGLPYVYRDSEPNPEARESDQFDKGRYEEMARRVQVLTLAWYFSGDERYAIHAAEHLRRWFVDPRTRMNPHFRYAASRPGVYDGHFSGVIEGVVLIEMLDYVTLLGASGAVSSADIQGLKSWFEKLSEWMVSSRFGRLEVHSMNNHGSYYVAQVLAFSSFAGDEARVQRAIPFARRHIRKQVEADGSMPLELDRADGLFYAVYGLRALVILARLAERGGVDLWHLSRNGTNILQQALMSLAPYLLSERPWQGTKLDTPYARYALQTYRVAARAYRSSALASVVRRIGNGEDVWPWEALVESPIVTDAQVSLPGAQEWAFERRDVPRFVEVGRVLGRKVKKGLALSGLWPGARIR